MRVLLHRLGALVMTAGMLLAGPTARATDAMTPEERELVETWAQENHAPVSLGDERSLAFLAPLIGDAQLVSFGEGVHGAAEPLVFRNTLFRYLASEMEFTALAVESGIIEGFAIDDWIANGVGDSSAVAETGLAYGFGAYPQQAELMEWMRAQTLKDEKQQPLHFRGFDISTARGDASPRAAAFSYLQQVEPAQAAALEAALAPFEDQLWVDRINGGEGQYQSLSQEQRDIITGAIADLVALFELNAPAYAAQTGKSEYERAYLAALAARQADVWLRQHPVGWTPADGPVLRSVSAADHGKAENIDWILQQEGDEGRVMLFAHFGHLAPTGVRIHLPGGRVMPLPAMVGEYLPLQHSREDIFTIGHLLAEDGRACGQPIREAQEGALESILAGMGPDAFMLNLRNAPAPVREALSGEHKLFGTQPTHALDLIKGADMILFTKRVTPAKPCEEP